MAIKTISDIVADIIALLNTNGNNEITGALIQVLAIDTVDSLQALTSRVLPVIQPVSGTQNLNMDSGTAQEVDLVNATADIKLSLSNAKAGGSYFLKIIQHPTTPRNVTWAINVKWPGGTAPTTSVGASAVDTVVLFFDGVDFYANFAQDFS